MRTQTIHLNSPLTLAKGTTSKLIMREPLMSHEEDALTMAQDIGKAQNPLTGEMCLYALLVDAPYDVIRNMPASDYQKLRNAYSVLTRPQVSLEELGTPPASSKPSDVV